VTETNEPFCLGRVLGCVEISDEARKAAECPNPNSCVCAIASSAAAAAVPLPSRSLPEHAPAPVSSNPRSVEEIFKDFSGRRVGLVRALTSGNDRSPPARLAGRCALRPAQI